MRTTNRVLLFTILFAIGFSLTAAAWSLGESDSEKAGWALDNDGNKFFAVGLWGIPGYVFAREGDAEPAENDSVYAAVTSPFNTVIVQAGYRKTYMSAREPLFMSGLSTLNWMMSANGYTGETPLADSNPSKEGAVIGFDRMNSIRENAGAVGRYMAGTVIPYIEKQFDGVDLIHFIMDEPDTGRRGWFWPPEVMQLYHDAVHERSPEGLTFIGLGGSIGANRYFYERNFGRVFRTGKNPARGECNPSLMDTYNFAYDGAPQFEYISGIFRRNRWERKPNAEMAYAFFENVRQTAAVYGSACDIIGWNSYTEFRDFPEAAGETVDAIRTACGESKPVWLFYDGAAYSKPSDMSYEEYGILAACQVYTAIIHGATGALFFAYDAPSDYMRIMAALAAELDGMSHVFKLPETEHGWDRAYHSDGYDHLHYSVRTGPAGVSWLIVANTSKRSPCTVEISGFPAFELEPLGAAVVRGE